MERHSTSDYDLLIEASEKGFLASWQYATRGEPVIDILAPEIECEGFEEGKHRTPQIAKGVPPVRRGILDDDDLATGFDHSEDFAQRQFTVAIRLLMQQKEYQCSIVNRIRQPQPAGVHGQQPHRRSRRQLGFQVSELDRQNVHNVDLAA